MKKIIFGVLFGAVAWPGVALADDNNNQLADLGNVSLENLGNVVTSVSRRPEDPFRAAAAIYVITNDDIRASGATHIAEVLRGVPGLDVAQVDSSDWAISSRGFNGLFADKLLVQIDGRTLYTPLDAGVYWDIQNIPLEDIERIEIIRGPGATQWGSNAVNGVINIITKSAAATQGTFISEAVGTQNPSITDVRYGGKIGEDTYYRAYGEFSDRGATPATGGAPGHDAWQTGKGGFRSDWNQTSTSKVTLQGDVYSSVENFNPQNPAFSDSGVDSFLDVYGSSGMNILGRWEERHSDSLQSTFQAYMDYQHIQYSALDQSIYTYDFDYQTAWKANERNSVMWGAGARFVDMTAQGTPPITIARNINSETVQSAFLQDSYAVMPNLVYFTLGSKFEINTFTGLEVEPSARMSWYVDDKQTIWAAVSRAVRTPSIADESRLINVQAFPPNGIAQEEYNPNVESEELVAYEIGHRIKPTTNLSFDSTAFINVYSKLNTFEPLNPVDAGGGNSYYPYQINNLGAGHAYGFEESAIWDVNSMWSLKANYTYLNLLLNQGASQDPTFLGQSGDSPHHQFMIRSQLYLPNEVQFINTGYYVERLPDQGVGSYFRFDTQVTWAATNNIELSLVGQNLLDANHPEFGGSGANGSPNEIPRSVYGKITFRY